MRVKAAPPHPDGGRQELMSLRGDHMRPTHEVHAPVPGKQLSAQGTVWLGGSRAPCGPLIHHVTNIIPLVCLASIPLANPAALYRLGMVCMICQGQPGMAAWRRFAALQGNK